MSDFAQAFFENLASLVLWLLVLVAGVLMVVAVFKWSPLAGVAFVGVLLWSAYSMTKEEMGDE